MAVTKDDLRINESDYYRIPKFQDEPRYHTITEKDTADPENIAFAYDLSRELWKVVLRFNGIVDPLDDLVVGNTLAVPTISDIQRLKDI